ncbi:ABC transporter ATP-binding protein [Nocardioides sp. L-11A]|uniref:dipeptide ABC transporter ATP-binding protein n=1 Tax=Nocardioides sp. L-11A TaxID=3043848 RepID=UPI00249B109C|nr:ABC transporter ATP-binding protein [Nocardioides sp. L-11A]
MTDLPRPAPAGAAPLLTVRGLGVSFGSTGRRVTAVHDLDFEVGRGETVAIVGESGSGKSTSGLALLGLLPGHAAVEGSAVFDGEELLGRSDRAMQKIRGGRIAYVPQNPFGSLDPVYTVGHQIVEAIRAHRPDVAKPAAREEALTLIEAVGIDNPAGRFEAYPHQLSGGMRQRVVIAMALANRPSLIIADEPTSALDVTVQEQVLDTLERARELSGASLILITHDMGVVARCADRVLVMYAGRCVETGTTDDVFGRPRMPYTLGLLGGIPRLDLAADAPLIRMRPATIRAVADGCAFAERCPASRDACRTAVPELLEVQDGHAAACIRLDDLAGQDAAALFESTASPAPATQPDPEREPVLAVDHLVKHFRTRRGKLIHAVCDVSLDVRPGETLAIVGESGSGKTTLMRALVRAERPTSGSVSVDGTEITHLSVRRMREHRRRLQMVLQDSTASLNPKLTVGALIAEPLEIHGRRSPGRVAELLTMVGLPETVADRFPGELSGGQRQRVAIARGLAVEPDVLVLDEPVSALDVSVQADVLALLRDLQRRLGVAYVFVTHDLGVVRHIADRVAVMYLGRIVETGRVEDVLSTPRHPYTRALVAAVPLPDPVAERTRTRIRLVGEVPSAQEPPSGCRFRTRCPVFEGLDAADRAVCVEVRPRAHEGRTAAACHHLDDLSADERAGAQARARGAGAPERQEQRRLTREETPAAAHRRPIEQREESPS